MVEVKNYRAIVELKFMEFHADPLTARAEIHTMLKSAVDGYEDWIELIEIVGLYEELESNEERGFE